MLTIILVRHGETYHNINRIIQGQSKSILSSLGIKQAKAVSKYLAKTPIDIVYSSDLTRTKHTCKLILNNRKIPVIYDKRIRERHYGKYQNKSSKIFAKAANKSTKLFTEFKPLGGESILDLYKRAKEFLEFITKKYDKGTILIVTHGGVMANMLIHIANDSHDNFKKYHPKNCAITTLKINKNIKIAKLNYMKHLKNV